MRRIVEAFKAVVISIFENSRKKSTLSIVFLSVVVVIGGLMISSIHNSLSVILMLSGTSLCLIVYVYRWRNPLWFLILIIFSIIGFPFFVLLHNAFYAVAEISKNIFLLKSIFELLHAISFISAISICPITLILGITGLIVTSLIRWKQREAR